MFSIGGNGHERLLDVLLKPQPKLKNNNYL